MGGGRARKRQLNAHARRVVSPGRRRRAAEEVDLDLADEPVAELGVADARSSVRLRWPLAREAGGDVIGHDERSRLGEDPGLRNGTGAGADVAEGVDVGVLGPEVGLVDGHPAVDRQARGRERLRRPVNRDADEEVVRQRPAIRQLRRVRRRIDARDQVLGTLLDVSRGQALAEHLRDLEGDRDRTLHRKRRTHPHRLADAPLREVLVQQKCPFERSRRTLEGLAEDRDEDAPAVEVGQRVAQPFGAGERVELVAALLEARRGVHVVVGAERHDQEVRVVGAGVGRDAAGDGVDAGHRLLAKLDAVLVEVAVVQPHVVGCLPAEHHVELGEAEDEGVVAVQQRDADRIGKRLGEPRRQLQAGESGAEDEDVLLHLGRPYRLLQRAWSVPTSPPGPCAERVPTRAALAGGGPQVCVPHMDEILGTPRVARALAARIRRRRMASRRCDEA